MTATIIIVTLNRPDCVRKCLQALRVQSPAPLQVILVDASGDEATAAVVREFSECEYVRTSVGYGHMTASRNLGLARAKGEIVVFIDDDAFAHEGWLAALLEPYGDAAVGGVGGRALNNMPLEGTTGVDRIGRLLPDGTITGFFGADPGRVIDVDHLIGCNMSWRRAILSELGGLRDDYPGTEVREETDLALRVRAVGYRLVFQPRAVVTHVGAPQAKGRRFDVRYAYYASRNHAMLMVRNFGVRRAIAWRSGVREAFDACLEAGRRTAGAALRLAVRLAGLVVGTFAGLRHRFAEGGDPRRRGAVRIETNSAPGAGPGTLQHLPQYPTSAEGR